MKPMNKCCAKCSGFPEKPADIMPPCTKVMDCECHHEKTTHEIGAEESLSDVGVLIEKFHHKGSLIWIAVKDPGGDFVYGIYDERKLKAAVASLLTLQQKKLKSEHLKDISKHRKGAYKHGGSDGEKTERERIVEVLERKRSNLSAMSKTDEAAIQQTKGYDQALTDAIEAIKAAS